MDAMIVTPCESWSKVAATGPVPEGPEAGVWPLDEHNVTLLDNVCPRDWKNPERPSDFVYDLIAVGGGAAGLVSARQSAKRGARSALIEKHLAGGDCLNIGCVPSKALLRCARAVAELRRDDLCLVREAGAPAPAVDFQKVMERMRRLRAKIAPMDSFALTAKVGADMYAGSGVFKGPNEIEVGGRVLKFRKAVITTGGRAMVPPIPGLEAVPYLTNATLFNLTALPPRLVVIGGGPIGLEMAQSFARFGSKVTVLEMMPDILGCEDPEAAAVLKKVLSEDGVRVLVNTRTERIDHVPAGTSIEGAAQWPNITLNVSVGAASEAVSEAICCDALLVACGRVPNVEGLGLEAAGVCYHPMRGIEITDELLTANPDILAIGDCCNRPEARLTHMSGTMAGMAVQKALFDEGLPPNAPSLRCSDLVVPRCVYTEPEIAFCGLSVAGAKRKGVAFDEYKVSIDDNDRAILEGAGEGAFARVICEEGTEKIIGAAVVGERAGDVLAEVTLAMQQGIGLSHLARTIHPYPTIGEAIQQCALQYNRARWKRVVHE